MLKRAIPSSGELLAAVGLGTWQTFDVGADVRDRQPLAAVLSELFEAGGSLIDSSPMYGRSEQVVGDLLAQRGDRNRAFVATKVWTRGREAGIAQMERSIALLKGEPLDLIQVHNLLDARVHLATQRDWKAAGRVRYLGVTHYQGSAHAELAAFLRQEPLDFVQFNYALDDRAAETTLLPLAAERGVAVLVNRPFGEGALIRRLRRLALPEFAAEIGCASWAELALKYLLANPAVTCIIPATSVPAHMASNARAGLGALPDAAMRRRILAAAGV